MIGLGDERMLKCGLVSSTVYPHVVQTMPSPYLNKAEVIKEAYAHYPTLAEAYQAQVWESF